MMRLAQACYLGLLAWQLLWRVPAGSSGWLSWTFFAITLVLLILPLRGIMAGRHRAMIWGGYLVVGYFIIGVAEAWEGTPVTWLMPVVAMGYVGAATMAIRGSRQAP